MVEPTHFTLLRSIRTIQADDEKYVSVQVPQMTHGRLGFDYKLDQQYMLSSDFVAHHSEVVQIALTESTRSPLFVRFTYIVLGKKGTPARVIVLSYELWLNEELFTKQMQERGTFDQEYDWVVLLGQLETRPGLRVTTNTISYQGQLRSKSLAKWNDAYPLFPHQWNSLLWMEDVEKQIREDKAEYSSNNSAIRIGQDYIFHRGINEFQPAIGLTDVMRNKIRYKGGICADATGSGKTATILALMLRDNTNNTPMPPKSTFFSSRATLIITPVNLPRQWVCEITKFCSAANWKVIEILDQRNAKQVSLKTLCEDCDVVITTRTHLKNAQYIRKCNQQWVLASGVQSISESYSHSQAWLPVPIIRMATRAAKKQGMSWESYVPLSSIWWHRIIIDEVHEEHPEAFLHGIEGGTWFGLTGTPEPIENNLYAALLLNPPTATITQTFVNKCIHRNQGFPFAYQVHHKTCMITLRPHHAEELANISEEDVEAQVTTGLLSTTAEDAAGYVLPLMPLDRIIADFDRKYQKKSQDILRRQMHCKDDLKETWQLTITAHKVARQYEYFSQICQDMIQRPDFNWHAPCPICYDRNANSMLLCGHMFCRECLEQSFVDYPQCGVCKESMTKNDAYEIERHDTTLPSYYLRLSNQYGEKMRILLTILRDIVVQKEEKAVVFLQYTSLLRSLQRIIDTTYPTIRTGTLLGNTLSRAATVERFMHNQTIDVLFLPMELSNSGLNLTAANHILYVHPMMGTSKSICVRVNEQCNGRVIRPTQKKNVYIYYLVIENSAEEEAIKNVAFV